MGSKELRVELIKLRKQISEKDKEISELRTSKLTLEKLRKTESVSTKKPNEIFEKEQFLQKCQEEDVSKIIEDKSIIDIPVQFTSINKIPKEIIKQDFSFKELIEENEFLKTKYQKYNSKYIKFKAKYSETRNFLDVLLQKNTFIQQVQPQERSKSYNIVSVEPQVNFDLLKNKRKADEAILEIQPIKEIKENKNKTKNEKKNENKNEKQIEKQKSRKEKVENLDESEVKEVVNKRGRKKKMTDFEKKLEKLTKMKKVRMSKKPKENIDNTFDDSSEGGYDSDNEEQCKSK
jgi:hypothetical protein